MADAPAPDAPCGVVTIPDQYAPDDRRYVLCGRPRREHPVRGAGRLVDHDRWATRERPTYPPPP